MKKVTKADARNLVSVSMPKAMSNFIEQRKHIGNYIKVNDEGSEGILIKSRDCTVVVFPNWNCNEQIARIANKLNGKVVKGQSYY